MPAALQVKVEFRNGFRSSIRCLKNALYVQTWKQACPICLRQGLRQRWRVARGRGLGDPSGERPENEKPIDRGQTCLSGRQSKRGGGLQLDEEWA